MEHTNSQSVTVTLSKKQWEIIMSVLESECGRKGKEWASWVIHIKQAIQANNYQSATPEEKISAKLKEENWKAINNLLEAYSQTKSKDWHIWASVVVQNIQQELEIAKSENQQKLIADSTHGDALIEDKSIPILVDLANDTRTGLHALMDEYRKKQLPESHRNWNKKILLHVTNRKEIFYEWTIKDGLLKIVEGKTQEPDLILRGDEIAFIKFFASFDSGPVTFLMPTGKVGWPMGDTIKFGALRGKILFARAKEMESQLITEASKRMAEELIVDKKIKPDLPKLPIFREDEIILSSSLKEIICYKCEKRFLGVARARPKETGVTVRGIVGYQCQNCGAELCVACRDKSPFSIEWDNWKNSYCPKCGGQFDPGPYILSVLQKYETAFLSESCVWIDPNTGVVHHQPDFNGSVLEGITYSLLHDKSIGDVATSGIMGNKYANDLKKMIESDAQAFGKEFFAKLIAGGSIMNPNAVPVVYQGAVNAQIANPPIDIGKIIVLYTQDIANMLKEHVTLDTFERVYKFFLCDFQRYIEELGIRFDDNEELVDWRILVTRDSIDQTSFKLVTNKRILNTKGGDTWNEVQLLEGENRPLAVLHGENDLQNMLGQMYVFRTNKRLIWEKERMLKKTMIAVGEIDKDDVIKSRVYFKKSKLLVLLTDCHLLVWPEDEPLKTILLVDITKIEATAETVEKKAPLISHKATQNKIVLYSPNKHEIDVAAKDQDAILKFLEPINK